MNRAAALIALAACPALTACDLIDPPDRRIGEEPVSECVDRLAGWNRDLDVASGARQLYVPTYLYDITKMDLEAIQDLIGEGDETAGTRGMAATNETSTAVDAFKSRPVDEDGAFFLGNDPAYYRVRGAAQPFETITQVGCERQQANMRLVEIEAVPMQTGSPADTVNAD